MATNSEAHPVSFAGGGGPQTVDPGGPRLGVGEIWRRPLPHLRRTPLTRFLCRSLMTWSRRYVLEVRGLEKIAPDADPFLFVANHNHRLEAVLLPALLIFHRRGKLVHFLADWPTLLVPGAGLLLRRSGAITVASKSARWPLLNRLRPLFAHPAPAFERARRALLAGSSVGIFPEATMNRDPRRLLRGQTGAARLALRAGVPVVPAGIRFPGHDPGTNRPIADREPMVIEIGDPIEPPEPAADTPPERGAVRELHALVMTELARLSGKSWTPQAQRRRYRCP